MFEVTIEAGFSSGHYLRNYQGKCEKPHGHNYRVLVTLAGAELDQAGLLLDFKILKTLLKPVVDYLDHQMINDLPPFTEINPSAENLARYFYDQTSRQLQALTSGRVSVKDCTVFETDTSFACYYK
jgi:6-pyruvoyltetrahydropterin/6-carboxytetrahydropterin synthase